MKVLLLLGHAVFCFLLSVLCFSFVCRFSVSLFAVCVCVLHVFCYFNFLLCVCVLLLLKAFLSNFN